MEAMLKKQFNDIDKTEMRLIPAGRFLMGADDWGEFEGPVHEVFVDDFLIDETPVTNTRFARFVEETKYKTTAEQTGFAPGYENGIMKELKGLNWRAYYSKERANHPVVLVSWHDANEYAKWAGKRLPTEAEWEKAARGDLNQNLYPWGNQEPDNTLCNFGKTTKEIPATTEIKTFPANAFGLYDMAGNVWNWCADWFSENYYSESGSVNPSGAIIGNTRVRRGASFNIIQPFRLRCSNRGAFIPENYAINIGFRCAKDFRNE
jgi:formylglycine-generating enzyme